MHKTQTEEFYDQRLKSFESMVKDKDDEIARLLDEQQKFSYQINDLQK